jgi:hypothetical protein
VSILPLDLTFYIIYTTFGIMQPPAYKSDMKEYILVDEKVAVKGEEGEGKAREIAIWVDGRAAGRISRQALLDAR